MLSRHLFSMMVRPEIPIYDRTMLSSAHDAALVPVSHVFERNRFSALLRTYFSYVCSSFILTYCDNHLPSIG